ncbi:cadherin-like beta sandwich domain-containing protein [Zongyangia hominis]|uniref:Cadherin-like beta sandwich domain-containing protein n=1 Tax=Zongyangia hominis TaxID=2763677 RepID=A0A926ECA9_9FIRM|nr:cadherin-like beta sandwich domain-containing protein [Zongyangia hominis]MBC8571183.1 cadherin-like beta sandwich domain-containing protein [Zongyangia hominis]
MRRNVTPQRLRRRILALIVCLAMVFSCLPSAAINVPDGNGQNPGSPLPYAVTDNMLAGAFTGDYTVDQDAGSLTLNKTEGNNHAVSEVTADAFILEADITFEDGLDAGFLFGATDRNNLGVDWYAIKIGPSQVRLFSDNGSYNLNQYGSVPSGTFDNGNYKVHFKLAVTEDNVISAYVNGQAVLSYQYDAYHGGYLGFTGYFCQAKFENIILRENTELPPQENEEPLTGWTGSPTVDPYTGAVTVTNNQGNNHVLSETKANAFTMEADISFLEGGDAGFLFSTVNRTNLGTDWIGIKATYSQLRLFDEGNQAALDVRKPIPDGAIVDGKFHLKLNVDADGNIKVYLGGSADPLISVQYDEYVAGYVGLTTYNCTAKFENLRFYNNDPVGFTTNLNGIHSVSGNWSLTTRGYRGNNTGLGDAYAMFTDTVDGSETFVFEGDMHLENSNGIGGLVFGVKNPDSPTDEWYCINVGKRWGTQAKMLKNMGGTEIWNKQRGLTQAEIEKKDYHLRLEVLEGGTLNYYLDGSLIGTYVESDFAGGTFGVMTNGGDVTFNNVNYYKAKNPRITDMSLSGAALSEPYAEGKGEYLAVADKDADAVGITLTADAAFALSVNKQSAESGKAVSVPLNDIGYTSIAIKVEDPVGHISRTLPSGCARTRMYPPSMTGDIAPSSTSPPNTLL